MEAATFIEYGGRAIPSRPKQFDKEVLEEVFDYIRPKLQAYLEKDEYDFEALRKAFLKISSTDGYDISRYMETYAGLGGSAELVEIFDNAPFREILSRHEKTWVDYFKIEPLLKVGDTVKYYFIEGKITDLETPHFHGYYSVKSAEQKDSSFFLVPWEKCELVKTE